MGYIFLMISLLGGGVKVYCAKRVSLGINEMRESMIVNLLRMILCCIIGFFLTLLETGTLAAFKVNGTFLVLSMLSGIFSTMFVILWLISVKNGAYAMVDAFVMAGTLIPMLGSSMVFGEKISYAQLIGFAAVVAGVAILCSYNNSLKGKLGFKSLVILLLVGISAGASDFIQKLFVNVCASESNAVFNFYTYLFSAFALVVAMTFRHTSLNVVKTKMKSVWGYILIMAVGLFVNSYFKVEAARFIDAAKLYPLSQGVGLSLGIFIAAVWFGEKIKFKTIAGLLIVFLGICTINGA